MSTVSQIQEERNKSIQLNNFYIIYKVVKWHLKLSYAKVRLYTTNHEIMTNIMNQSYTQLIRQQRV